MAGSLELDLDDSEDEEEPVWWRKHGYLAGKHLEGPFWMCVREMIYTYRVMVCTEDSADLEFYCYPKTRPGLSLAMQAFASWDGKNGDDVVPDGYTRHHTRGGD
jgi:hypothetical protein